MAGADSWFSDIQAKTSGHCPEEGHQECPDETASIEVPYDMLQPDTLRSVIEEFVTRDGTNLAEMDQSVQQVMRQLQSGRVKLWFDPQNNSCTIRQAMMP